MVCQHAAGVVRDRGRAVRLLRAVSARYGPRVPGVAAVQHVLCLLPRRDHERGGAGVEGGSGCPGGLVEGSVLGDLGALCSW